MAIDAISQRYGVLPSTILKNDIVELQFDMLVASVGVEEQIKQQKDAEKKAKMKGRHGK